MERNIRMMHEELSLSQLTGLLLSSDGGGGLLYTERLQRSNPFQAHQMILALKPEQTMPPLSLHVHVKQGSNSEARISVQLNYTGRDFMIMLLLWISEWTNLQVDPSIPGLFGGDLLWFDNIQGSRCDCTGFTVWVPLQSYTKVLSRQHPDGQVAWGSGCVSVCASVLKLAIVTARLYPGTCYFSTLWR